MKTYLCYIFSVALCLILTFSFAGCAMPTYVCEIIDDADPFEINDGDVAEYNVVNKNAPVGNSVIRIGSSDFTVRYRASHINCNGLGMTDAYDVITDASESNKCYIETDSEAGTVTYFSGLHPYPAIDNISALSDTEIKETVEAMLGNLADFSTYNVFELKPPSADSVVKHYRLTWDVKREIMCDIGVTVYITADGLIDYFDKRNNCPDNLTKPFLSTAERNKLLEKRIKTALCYDSMEGVQYDIISEKLGYCNGAPQIVYVLEIRRDGFINLILCVIRKIR